MANHNELLKAAENLYKNGWSSKEIFAVARRMKYLEEKVI